MKFKMKIVFTILMFTVSLLSFAQDNKDKKVQKKDEYKVSATIKTVRSLLKDKKYSNANDEVNKALKQHEEAGSSAQLYSLQSLALYNLVLDENKKMYLNQNPDTSKYFEYIYSLYTTTLKCDSLDMLPNEKGKVEIKYRGASQQRLVQFRKNLSTAGKFFYRKKDYKRAYRFTDLYLTTKTNPVFNLEKGSNALSSETDSVEHSSLAVFLAYAYNNYNGVVKYLPVALQDTSKLEQLLQVGAISYFALNDSTSGNNMLKEGVKHFPSTDFFYMTLLKDYNAKGEYRNALELVDTVLVHMPDNRNCLFLKAKEHEYLSQYDEANATLMKVVEKNEQDFEAYSTLGAINLKRAHVAYDNFNLKVTDSGYSKGKQRINDYYRKAKDAYEKCRKYAENNTSLWLSGLRECYYKLNMGRELRALEKFK